MEAQRDDGDRQLLVAPLLTAATQRTDRINRLDRSDKLSTGP